MKWPLRIGTCRKCGRRRHVHRGLCESCSRAGGFCVNVDCLAWVPNSRFYNEHEGLCPACVGRESADTQR